MQRQHVRHEQNAAHVAAWDMPTRLFHWTLAALILTAWLSYRFSESFGDNLLKWHRWNGLAILVLLVWRVLWGIVGSSTARFGSFLRGPAAVLGYARDLLAGRSRRFLGHNPAGSLMVLALLSIAAVQGALGLFTVEHNDLTAGPLYRLVDEATTKQISRWHRWLYYWVLLPAVALHVTANVLYGVVKREPLIKAMLTGRKPAAAYEDQSEAAIVTRPLLRAAICLAVAGIIVLGGINASVGRLV